MSAEGPPATPSTFAQDFRATLAFSAREKWQLAIAALLFAAAALLPLASSGYWLSLGISIAMFTVLATSWALFSGPTNYISLATAAFFGVGMYIVGAGLNHLPSGSHTVNSMWMWGALLAYNLSAWLHAQPPSAWHAAALPPCAAC